MTSRLVKDWWPAVAWAAAIFFFSTEYFSGERTGALLFPLLRWLMPGATPEALAQAHFLIRKAAHVFVYFVFGLLLLRGVRGGSSGWKFRWAVWAWGIATIYAMSDEFHQLFVPGRGGAVSDVFLDSAAAGIAQGITLLICGRTPRSGATTSSRNEVEP